MPINIFSTDDTLGLVVHSAPSQGTAQSQAMQSAVNSDLNVLRSWGYSSWEQFHAAMAHSASGSIPLLGWATGDPPAAAGTPRGGTNTPPQAPSNGAGTSSIPLHYLIGAAAVVLLLALSRR